MDLDLVFGALADPTRRAIIDRLRGGELSSGELADPLPISRPAVSQHLKVLEEAGLITRTKHSQRRIVSLNAEHLSGATGWLLAAHEEWQQRFDNLETVLAEDGPGRDRATSPAEE
ncbi:MULTISPECIES: metalloregulator ArsR/SmtB family transcription factor [unclassified Brevibacterium]|uniref:ArsR/SmtB family transcription factor n=1 Tax=unclassified Brevibacterium TaxID=2614124 RepID=UPI001E44A902|nr:MULTISPECIES: metalloregulator ArsR/SmtB family transcription factor [unclassified Brevibacterium]MCD1287136.1 transcriptional regulator [Brevibacterium sp. CCUG 69071]MDK8436364.1 metalloregulator ArsR/SmtB family transcription factor [Brevibacterium sp. H-BE7]